MEFAQPTNSIVTDKTKAEEKRVTEIRNQVSLLEGESMRLRDLIQAEKYEINELVKQKAELESQLPLLNDKVSILKNVIENLMAEELGLRDLKVKIAGELEAATKHLEIVNENVKIERDLIQNERETLEAEKVELAIKQEMVNAHATVLAEKLAKLREIIL